MNSDGEGGGNGVRIMLILKLNHLYKLSKNENLNRIYYMNKYISTVQIEFIRLQRRISICTCIHIHNDICTFRLTYIHTK